MNVKHSHGGNGSTRKPAGKNETPISLCAVRAHFIARGSSLNQWAKRNGYRSSTLTMALQGHRRGPMSRRIISRLREECSL